MKARTIFTGLFFQLAYLLSGQRCCGQEEAVKIHNLPFAGREIRNSFNVIGSTFISLPVRGGIYEAVYKTWLIPPSARLGILNFDLCTADTSLVVAMRRGDSLVLAKGKNNGQNYITRTYCTLPLGVCQVTSTGLDSFFVWHYNRDFSSIYFFNGHDSLKTIVQVKDTITAFHAVSPSSFLFALGPKLFSLNAGNRPALLVEFSDRIDGLAQDGEGHPVISTGKGIYRVIGKDQAEMLLGPVHGFIRCEGSKLFLLDRERGRIVEIGL